MARIGRWRSSLPFLFVAMTSGGVNGWSSRRLVNRDTGLDSTELLNVLNSLTTLLVLSTLIVFVRARELREGEKWPRDAGMISSAITAVVAGVSASSLVDSAAEFRLEIGLFLAIITFLSLAPTARIAGLLANGQMTPIACSILTASIVRAAVLESSIGADSLTGVLSTIAVAQTLGVAPLLVVRTRASQTRQQKLHLSPSVLATVGGFVGVVATASTALAYTLPESKDLFAQASAPGRGVFVVSLIVAFAVFPRLCVEQSYSRELGRWMRETQIFVLLFVVLSAVFVFVLDVDGFLIQQNTKTSADRLTALLFIGWSLLSIALLPLLSFLAHGSKLGALSLLAATTMLAAQVMTRDAEDVAWWFVAATVATTVSATGMMYRRTRTRVVDGTWDARRCSDSRENCVSLVIPSYNPGARIGTTIHDAARVLESLTPRFEVIVVTDGSTDESIEYLNSLDEQWFRHLHLTENVGKGAALREGFRSASGDVIGFIDADGDIPASVLEEMLREVMAGGADIAYGSKWHPRSTVQITPGRRIMSTVQGLLQRALFQLKVDDTQAGAKVYRSEVLRAVEPTLTENGYALDLEIFVSSASHGYRRFVACPVTISRDGPSTISLSAVVRTFTDMMRIFWRARIELQYLALASGWTDKGRKVEH